MRLSIIASLMLVLVTAAGAQATPAQRTRPGDTVKVWAEALALRGAPAIVQRSTPDTIYFSVRSAVSRDWIATPIAQGQITRLDIRDISRSSGSRTFLGIASGALIGGAVVGSVIYFTHDMTCRSPNPADCDEFGPEVDRAIYTILGGAGGALLGGLVGGAIGSRPVVMWKRVFP